MDALLERPPEALAARLAEGGPGRLAFWRDAGRLRASRPEFEALAEALDADEGSDGHEAVLLATAPSSGALFGAFLHRTARGQTQGGLRHLAYPRLADFLSDGLRLSRDMGRKCALAGLWWSGGKGLIAAGTPALEGEARATLFREYGDFVASLCGAYVTAEDAGTTPRDVAHVFERTRFATCIPPAAGGSGNPAPATAEGVVRAMEAGLAHLGAPGLRDARVVLQGVGRVGAAILEGLLARGVGSVLAGDTDAHRVDAIRRQHPGAALDVRRVAPGDVAILAEPCDVLAPNALGGIFGPETIPSLRARLVCGAANSQLVETPRDARALAERGVVLLPDFLVNRMGIVQCANEQYGAPRPDPAIEAHLDPQRPDSIPGQVRRLLTESAAAGTTPTELALAWAEAKLEHPHPIWGLRTATILDALARNGWADQPG